MRIIIDFVKMILSTVWKFPTVWKFLFSEPEPPAIRPIRPWEIIYRREWSEASDLKLTDEFLAHLLEKKIISSFQKDTLSTMPNNTEKDKCRRNDQFVTILHQCSHEQLDSLYELLMNVNHGARKYMIPLLFHETWINKHSDQRINEQLSRLAYIHASAQQGCIEETLGSSVFRNYDIMLKLAEYIYIDEKREIPKQKLPLRQCIDRKTARASKILSDKQNSTENPSLNPSLGHSFFPTASQKQTDITDIDETTCTKQARFS